ncbi:hypothetical protein D3C72_1444030 [compost metagenome]
MLDVAIFAEAALAVGVRHGHEPVDALFGACPLHQARPLCPPIRTADGVVDPHIAGLVHHLQAGLEAQDRDAVATLVGIAVGQLDIRQAAGVGASEEAPGQKAFADGGVVRADAAEQGPDAGLETLDLRVQMGAQRGHRAQQRLHRVCFHAQLGYEVVDGRIAGPLFLLMGIGVQRPGQGVFQARDQLRAQLADQVQSWGAIKRHDHRQQVQQGCADFRFHHRVQQSRGQLDIAHDGLGRRLALGLGGVGLRRRVVDGCLGVVDGGVDAPRAERLACAVRRCVGVGPGSVGLRQRIAEGGDGVVVLRGHGA